MHRQLRDLKPHGARAPLALTYFVAAVLVLAGCASPGDEASDAATPTGSATEADSATLSPDPVETDEAATPEPKAKSKATAKAKAKAKAKATAGTEVTSESSAFGPMLFDAAGQAMYIWESENSASPECYDSCEEAWPPVLTEGSPIAGGKVKTHLLGTTDRRDGSTQVTYNDHPLYYYAHEGPGEVKCHNVATHGGLWWVITPDGDRVA